MRQAVLLGAVVALVSLAACGPARVAGVPTFGKVRELTVSDIEAAVAAYRRDSIAERPRPMLGAIEIMSRALVKIYWTADTRGGYTTMRLSGNAWHTEDQMAVIRE